MIIEEEYIQIIFGLWFVSATVLTGCIEEVFPEDSTATSDQIGASATAIKLRLMACHRKWYKVIWCTVSKPMRPTLLIPH